MPVAPVIHSNSDTIPHQVFSKPTIAPSTVAPSSPIADTMDITE